MRIPVPFAAGLLSLLVASGCMAPPSHEDAPPAIAQLDGSLEHLKAAFNEHADAPRILVLLPPRCESTMASLQEARREVESMDHGSEVVWLVIWQDELLGDDFAAALDASRALDLSNTQFFYDNDWLAGSRLADGRVLAGQLKRAFLFYPPGELWSEMPPHASAWVHNSGRIGKENVGDAQRLTDALRWQWSVLARPR